MRVKQNNISKNTSRMAMWILQLKLQHNCIIGNRCRKFKCTAIGYPLETYKEKGYSYVLHLEKIDGEERNIVLFLQDLKKDKAVTHFEANNNTVFFLYKTKEEKSFPGQLSHAEKKIFHTKPVFVDQQGYEHWEVCAWNRDDLTHFIEFLKKNTKDLRAFKIERIQKTNLNEVFFPQIMPAITPLQKRAMDLAIAEGYYEFPRKIELEQLAKIMKLSLSTYREHLRKAEKRLLPHLNTTMIPFQKTKKKN